MRFSVFVVLALLCVEAQRRRPRAESASTSSQNVGCDESGFRSEMLLLHDRVRGAVEPKPRHPLPKTVWADDLAQEAKKFADVCPIGHLAFSMDGKSSGFFFQGVMKQSENIFYTSNSQPKSCPGVFAQLAVARWEEERLAWAFDRIDPQLQNADAATGCRTSTGVRTCMHYLNMIMYENFEIGCAFNSNCLACSDANNCEITNKCPELSLSSSMSMSAMRSAYDQFLGTTYKDCTSTRARVRGEYGSTTVVCRYRSTTMPIRGFRSAGYSIVLPYEPVVPFQTPLDRSLNRPTGRLAGLPWFHEQRYRGDQYFDQDTLYAYYVRPEGIWVAIKSDDTMCSAINRFVAENPIFQDRRGMLLDHLCRQNMARVPALELSVICPANNRC